MDLQSRVEPENANTSTSTASNKPWKLRQTCDLCSEAKIKCDKRNPRCGRCERLSYECMYSPARRIGRPRPRSPRAAQETRPATGGDSAHIGRDITSKDSAAQSQRIRPAELAEAARHQELNEAITECFPEDATVCARAGSDMNVNAGANSTAGASENNNMNADIHQASGIGGSVLSGPAQSLVSMHEVRHDPYEFDCATVAVATLRKLFAAVLEGGPSPPQNPTIVAAKDVLAKQIPHACKQAARMLVCPCSADMDNALLVASLASAILDIADAALRSFRPTEHTPDGQQCTVLALSTLTNISQVVTLFTHRYSSTQAGRPSEALNLLAASLRTTLKAMAEETTNVFLDGSRKTAEWQQK